MTCKKSLKIPIRNQKSRTRKPEIPLKNEKSRTLNVEMIYPSTKLMGGQQHYLTSMNVQKF